MERGFCIPPLQGSGSELFRNPRALPWALIERPFGAQAGWRGGPCSSRSSANLPKFERRYDASRREHEVKSRAGAQNTVPVRCLPRGHSKDASQMVCEATICALN